MKLLGIARGLLLVVPLLSAACRPYVLPPPPAPMPVVSHPEPAPAVSHPEVTSSRAGLEDVLREVAARHQGRLGVVAKHLVTGETAALQPDQHFKAASLYKLFVLQSAYRQIEAGRLDADEVLTLSKKALKHEPYAEWPLGTRTTVDCAMEAMITISGNAAAAMLVERLGGETQITADAQAQGLVRSFLTPEYAGSTPGDVAHLLESFWEGGATGQEMLALLLRQQRNDRLPLTLPPGVAVAHKTGELARLRHDAGIVFAPSGPYLLVVMSQDAPTEAAARNAVLDVSQAAYAYFEKQEPEPYRGLPPRLAAEVFQTPDETGRLTPLADEWSQAVPLARSGIATADGSASARVRDAVVPDLIALQRAATDAGARFWVTGGYRAPKPGDPRARPTTVLPCRIDLPPPKPATSPTAAAPRRPAPPVPSVPDAPHRWLGTVLALSDARSGEHASADYSASLTGSWLLAHAWEYGFVPAPAESAAGKRLGYEPWALRWVGREMAAHLHARGAELPATAAAELRQAGQDLAAARPAAPALGELGGRPTG